MWVRVGDIVEVIAGNDRGEGGKVLTVDRIKQRVPVEGVQRVFKHVRKSQRNPQGGRLSKEMPIPWSRVMLVCEKCDAATRLGAKFLQNGAKIRFWKKAGHSARPGRRAPRPAHAQSG